MLGTIAIAALLFVLLFVVELLVFFVFDALNAHKYLEDIDILGTLNAEKLERAANNIAEMQADLRAIRTALTVD